MKDLTKEELETTLQLLTDEVRKIQKQYNCGYELTAEDGFELLIERIEKKIKKCS